ncbi:MAG: prohibitin family protein [Sulfurimonas sp.]|uniref:prohibitin family protein n=1 Tax=Sulfurimonas sp. TaxID=2022749 RepID=UPI00260F3DD1|nr:prohibitin family protein [Sulfurimonas sp.]MCW8895630.1 prohibitin family protein [Sulfurimonas sp.]MCW8954569.1 prohibitin family protein [Sulfurimonas sp.]MCW9067950.1 prohibitin family protein [Sulfurimonas sp.]
MASDMNDYFNKKKSEGGGFKKPSGGGTGGGGGGPQMPKIYFNMSGKSGIVYFLIAVVILLVLAKPFTIIQEGERGILSTNGKYQDQALLPGLHFIVPVIQKVYIVDTKVRIINYATRIEASGRESGINVKPAITVLDKRGLPVTIELTVQYRLNSQFAAQTISNWGFSWEDKIINPVVRDVVRNVVGKYDAESLPQMRNQIAQEIDKSVRESVTGLKNSPADLQSVQLREIGLPQKVKEQIERVQVAKQEVQKAEQDVQRAKQEALKRAAEAEGIAQKKRIEAQGIADSVTIQADAKAKANILISKSLTTQLLQLEQIQVQGQFNDALRENKDAKIFLTPGGSTPNIWVDMKNGHQMKTSTGQ